MSKQKPVLYISLVGVNLIYAFTSYFTKSASFHAFLSIPYVLYIIGAVLTMAAYALIWQQIIKRMPVSHAYMFKGTAVIFTMLISVFFFGESLTLSNILGAIVIVFGIGLYAKS